jgi:hypothetical protein
MHPRVDQLIIGTRGGKVLEIRVFRWFNGTFRGTGIPLGG